MYVCVCIQYENLKMREKKKNVAIECQMVRTEINDSTSKRRAPREQQ